MMNLDLAKILFEEDSSNRLSKIFEENNKDILNQVEPKTRSQIEVLLNKSKQVLNGTLPKADELLKTCLIVLILLKKLNYEM